PAPAARQAGVTAPRDPPGARMAPGRQAGRPHRALAMAATARLAATGRGRTVLAAAPVTLALVAALAGPAAYSIDTAAAAHTGALPSAGPAVSGAFGGGPGGGFPGGAAPGPVQLSGGAGASGGSGRFPGGASGPGSAPARGTGGGSGGAGFPQAGGTGGFPGGAPGAAGGARAGGPGGLGGNTQVAAALTGLLVRGAAGDPWAAAAGRAGSAAPVQLARREPGMAPGGLHRTRGTPPPAP